MLFDYLEAPAKINLQLSILNKREDNYHDLLTLMEKIDLHDSLYIRVLDKREFINYKKLERDKYTALNQLEDRRIAYSPTEITNRIKEVFSELNLNCEPGLLLKLHYSEIGAKYKYPDNDVVYEDLNLTPIVSENLVNDEMSKDDRLINVNIKIISWVTKLEARQNILLKVISKYFSKMPSRIWKKYNIAQIDIYLLKKIPFMSGLGGGSSDAASLLKYLDKTYPYLNREDLMSMARSIGADVPFFIHKGTGICRGIGDDISKFPSLAGLPCLIMKPKVSVSTAKAFLDYDRFWMEMSIENRELLSAEKVIAANKFYEIIKRYHSITHSKFSSDTKEEIKQISRKLFINGKNDFYPLLLKQNMDFSSYYDSLKESSCIYANLSGSGSAFFALYINKSDADRAFDRLMMSDMRNNIEFLLSCKTASF